MNGGASDYLDRMRRLEDKLADEKCAREVLGAWFEGLEGRGRQMIGDHVQLLLNLLEDKQLNQKQVAERLGVSPAAVCEWKKGKISLWNLLHLRKLVFSLGIHCPPIPDLPTDDTSVVPGFVMAMIKLREHARERVTNPLTTDVYRSVRAATRVKAWWKARLFGTEDEVAKAFRELMQQGPFGELAESKNAVDEWAAAFLVSVNYIHRTFYKEA